MKMHLAAAVVLMMLIPAGVLAVEVPTDVTLSATETSIKVDWNGDTDDDGYYIYYGTTSGNLDQRITLDDSATEHTITDLESGTTYYIAVSAYENSIEGDRSAVKSITTEEDTGIPDTPTGLSVTGKSGIGQNFMTLKWDENSESDLDHYTLYYGTAPGTYTATLEAALDDADAFTVTGLSGSTRYYVSITAADASGNESEKAPELIVDTLVDTRPPNPPAGISGELSSADAITVSVQDGNARMADFSGTILYYGTMSGNLDQEVDLGRSSSHVLGGLTVGSTWYFAASAYDFSGNESAMTDEGSATVEETTRFLNQSDDYDGGCFIRAAGKNSGVPRALIMALVFGALLAAMRAKRLGIKCWRWAIPALVIFLLAPGISYGDNDETPEMPGHNIIGVAVGYYLPQESDFEDYYGDNTFPVYGFYERFFCKHISVNLEAGFMKESGYLLTASGAETRVETDLTLVPVSASLNFSLKLMPYVVGYVGLGPDYWYCQEKTDNDLQHPEVEEWVGGAHGKIGFRFYNTDENWVGTGALIESRYSTVDRFGDNETDIGGWTFKFGLFWHF